MWKTVFEVFERRVTAADTTGEPRRASVTYWWQNQCDTGVKGKDFQSSFKVILFALRIMKEKSLSSVIRAWCVTDQLHLPLQHCENSDDQTASLHHLRDNPVQVPYTHHMYVHTLNNWHFALCGLCILLDGIQSRLSDLQESREGHAGPASPPGYHLYVVLRQPGRGRDLTDRLHIFQLVSRVFPGTRWHLRGLHPAGRSLQDVQSL